MASQDAGHRCKTKCQQRFYSVHYTTFRPRKPRGRHFFWKPGRGDADAVMGERPWSCLESKVVWAEAHIWGTGEYQFSVIDAEAVEMVQERQEKPPDLGIGDAKTSSMLALRGAGGEHAALRVQNRRGG